MIVKTLTCVADRSGPRFLLPCSGRSSRSSTESMPFVLKGPKIALPVWIVFAREGIEGLHFLADRGSIARRQSGYAGRLIQASSDAHSFPAEIVQRGDIVRPVVRHGCILSPSRRGHAAAATGVR